MWPTVSEILTAALTGVIISTVSIYLANRRYRRERRWDRKFETYQAVLKSLHEMMEETGTFLDTHVTGSPLTQERQEELMQSSKQGLGQIKKQARIGSFIISNEAQAELEQLLQKLDNAKQEQDIFLVYDKQYGALKDALDQMLELARSDL